jgi:hypothetical protein
MQMIIPGIPLCAATGNFGSTLALKMGPDQKTQCGGQKSIRMKRIYQWPRSKVSFPFRADCAENGGARNGLSNIQLDNPLLVP